MIGEVPGVNEGDTFTNRQDLNDARVHKGNRQGIGGGGHAIVLSGGYVDDLDENDVIIYTGQGGRDENTGRQIADQELKRGNLQLAKHYTEGNPIRVSRGHQLDSPYAPAAGYRYDGLYRIDDFWHEHGADGFLVYRYRLVKIEPTKRAHPPATTASATPRQAAPTGTQNPQRSSVYTVRVIRNSAVANHVKGLYGHRCQISGEILDTPIGRYAEGCHIKPVGKPHNGPDTTENLLCLSPNMHVLFDKGAVAIADDLTMIGMVGQLEQHPDHPVSLECIRYHREHIFMCNHGSNP